MRLRGRRVALLIAGALPLLAEEGQHVEQPSLTSTTTADGGQARVDDAILHAAEFLHDDSLTRLPALPLELIGAPPLHVPIPRDSKKQQHKVPPSQPLEKDHDDDASSSSSSLLKANKEQQDDDDDSIIDESDSTEQAPLHTNTIVAAADEEADATPSGPNYVVNATATGENTTTTDGCADNVNGTQVETTNTTGITETSANETATELATEAQNTTFSNETTAGSEASDTTADATNNATTAADESLDEEAISERIAVDYASKSAGALILEKSNNFKGTSNLLNADRDKYAISPCQEKKFVVISLSEDILVKQVKLANYELYSSQVKEFQILGSQTMGKDWLDLGTYEAKPGSGMQSFDLKEPSWGRYLKFRFLSHYGDEYYCTISQIAVHGSTMVQGFHEHLEDELLEISNVEEEETLLVGNGSVVKIDKDASSGSNEKGGDTQQDDAGTPPSVESANATDASHTATNGTSDATNNQNNDPADASSSKQLSNTSNSDAAPISGETDSAEVPLEQMNGAENQTHTNATNSDCNNSDSYFLPVSRSGRNVSGLLPIASIGPSLQVFSSFLGRSGPWNSSNRKSTETPSSNDQACILTEELDSAKSTKLAHANPTVRKRLLALYESIKGSDDEASFGLPLEALEPKTTKQELAQRIAAYIEESEPLGTKQNLGSSTPDDETVAATDKATTKKPSAVAAESQPEVSDTGSTISMDALHDADLALAKLLNKVPSISCLKGLDYVAFKEKLKSARKGSHESGPGHGNEPMFKLLTDQIKALQFNLHVHDQFTKEAVLCYQRVMLDLVLEIETIRSDHGLRLSQLEQDIQETKTIRWIFLFYQMLMGLPHLASLFIATSFTTYAMPLLSALVPSWIPSMPSRVVDRLPLLPFSLPSSLKESADKIASLLEDEQISGWVMTGFVIMITFSLIYSLKQRLWPMVCERVQILGRLRYSMPGRRKLVRADSDPGVISGHADQRREQHERQMTVPGSLSFTDVKKGLETSPQEGRQGKRKIPVSPASVALVHACAGDKSAYKEGSMAHQEGHSRKLIETARQGLSPHIEEVELSGVPNSQPIWEQKVETHRVSNNGQSRSEPPNPTDAVTGIDEGETTGSHSSASPEEIEMEDLQSQKPYGLSSRSVSC